MPFQWRLKRDDVAAQRMTPMHLRQSLFCGLTITFLAVARCNALVSGSKPHVVRYEVAYGIAIGDKVAVGAAEGKADLTYTNEDGGTSQETRVTLPWKKSFVARPGFHLYVSAQNLIDLQIGIIIVSIYVDDVLFKTSQSKGNHVIASASSLL